MPGLNAVFAVLAIAGLVLIVSRLGYMRAFWASLAGLILATASSFIAGNVLMAGDGKTLGIMNASLMTATLFNTAIYGVTIIAPGIMMGVASRGLSSAVKTLWYGCIPAVVLLALMATFYISLLRNIPTVTTMVNSSVEITLNQNPNLAKSLMDQYGDAGSKEKIAEAVDSIVVFFIKLIPGTLVIGFMAFVTLGLSLAGTLGTRMRLMIPRLKPFYLWQASDWWLLPTAVGLALAIFGGSDLWRFAGGNILVVTGNVYALTGLAVIEAFFRKLAIPMFLRIAFYVIIFFMSFTLVSLLFLAILGLADSRFNFRKQTPDKEDLEET